MTTGLSGYEFKLETFLKVDDDEDMEDDGEEEEEEEETETTAKETEVDATLKEAKLYLSSESKDLYNHLAKVLIDLFDLRPTNAVDYFEALSLETKKKLSSSSMEYVSPISEKSIELTLAKIQKKIFLETIETVNEEEMMTEDEEPTVKNLLDSNYYFEQAGVGIHSDDVLKIFLAMKRLAKERGLQNVRFWGKIFGLEQNYFIVEADYMEGDEEEEEEEAEEENEEEIEEEEEDESFGPLPKINYKPPPKVPKEEPGTGINKKNYFVCNDPGKLWTKLPMVTPKQVYISRKIKKFFSGRLDAPIVSYPTFPGVEINYLRAQIARISAVTHISPNGYYISEEDAEEADGGEFALNPEYEPLSKKEQFAAGVEGWVHHAQYILPQGRCTWWNPTPDNDEEEEEEEEESGRRKKPIKKAKPQSGPGILTPLNKDKTVDKVLPWTVELSSNLFSEDGIVVIHSNLWPGAHAFCTENLFDNIYVGTGLKFTLSGFNPQMPRFLSTEYEVFGNELTEVDDPSVDEEFPHEEEEEEEEEEIGEGEDDDEDDEGDEDD